MHVVQVTGPQNSAAKLETVRAVIIHAGSCSRVKINSMAAAIAYKPSRPRLAFASRRPSSQTPHDHREHTVGQAADQFVGPSKGNRRSLSKAVVWALHKRWRRLPPTKQSPSQVEGDCFYRRLVPAPVTLPDSRRPVIGHRATHQRHTMCLDQPRADKTGKHAAHSSREQREPGEGRAAAQVEMMRLLEIRRQPGQVEIKSL